MAYHPPHLPPLDAPSIDEMTTGAADVYQNMSSRRESFSDVDSPSPVTPSCNLFLSPRVAIYHMEDHPTSQLSPLLQPKSLALAIPPVGKHQPCTPSTSPRPCLPASSPVIPAPLYTPMVLALRKNQVHSNDYFSQHSSVNEEYKFPLTPMSPSTQGPNPCVLGSPLKLEGRMTSPPPFKLSPRPLFKPKSAKKTPSLQKKGRSPKELALDGGSSSAHALPSSLLSPPLLAAIKAYPTPRNSLVPPTLASQYSCRFPTDYHLHSEFVRKYHLHGELGSGGFGFVMVARQRSSGLDVAVKFILRDKVPRDGWVNDPLLGLVPLEAAVLRAIDHPGVVKFIELFQHPTYLYLVQELHGSPWTKAGSTPSPPGYSSCQPHLTLARSPWPNMEAAPSNMLQLDVAAFGPLSSTMDCTPNARPNMMRRPSHDLFECIEQHKHLPEAHAKYIFAQVVDIVQYLDSAGICHRDIKDENLVIDRLFRVKLIDFGSAVVFDPRRPPPYFNKFFGTISFASSEILRSLPYRAPPAEIWTLGILLSFLVTGESPFADTHDAIAGKVAAIGQSSTTRLQGISHNCVDLMLGCLRPDPNDRLTIAQVKAHPWVKDAVEPR